MERQNDKIAYIKAITDGLIWIGQLGFSLVIPPAVLAFAGFRLSNRFDIGSWIIWLFIGIGLMTSVSTASGYIKKYKDEEKKKEAENPRPQGFNGHF